MLLHSFIGDNEREAPRTSSLGSVPREVNKQVSTQSFIGDGESGCSWEKQLTCRSRTDRDGPGKRLSFSRSQCARRASASQNAPGASRLRSRLRMCLMSPIEKESYTSLNVDLLMPYSAILAEMLRRDRPQILAQRPTLPWLFSSALRMYCCSMSAL